MRKSVCFVVFVILAALPILGQSPPAGPIAKFYSVKVKPGMEQKFEEAYKEHLAWHKQQKDPWTWTAFQWESGQLTGQYVVRTGDHSWEDFDKRGEMEEADRAAAARLLGFTESVLVSWSQTLPELSRPPSRPTPLLMVTQFEIHPQKAFQFLSAIKQVWDALKKAHWGEPSVWTREVAGIPGQVYSVVTFHQNWASLADPDTPLLAAVEKVLGHGETSQLVDSFWSCVKNSHSDIVRFRPDLSYFPGQE